jgi:hypothetical protein
LLLFPLFKPDHPCRTFPMKLIKLTKSSRDVN